VVAKPPKTPSAPFVILEGMLIGEAKGLPPELICAYLLLK
jgi:hypothetical protein